MTLNNINMNEVAHPLSTHVDPHQDILLYRAVNGEKGNGILYAFSKWDQLFIGHTNRIKCYLWVQPGGCQDGLVANLDGRMFRIYIIRYMFLNLKWFVSHHRVYP